MTATIPASVALDLQAENLALQRRIEDLEALLAQADSALRWMESGGVWGESFDALRESIKGVLGSESYHRKAIGSLERALAWHRARLAVIEGRLGIKQA